MTPFPFVPSSGSPQAPGTTGSQSSGSQSSSDGDGAFAEVLSGAAADSNRSNQPGARPAGSRDARGPAETRNGPQHDAASGERPGGSPPADTGAADAKGDHATRDGGSKTAADADGADNAASQGANDAETGSDGSASSSNAGAPAEQSETDPHHRPGDSAAKRAQGQSEAKAENTRSGTAATASDGPDAADAADKAEQLRAAVAARDIKAQASTAAQAGGADSETGAAKTAQKPSVSGADGGTIQPTAAEAAKRALAASSATAADKATAKAETSADRPATQNANTASDTAKTGNIAASKSDAEADSLLASLRRTQSAGEPARSAVAGSPTPTATAKAKPEGQAATAVAQDTQAKKPAKSADTAAMAAQRVADAGKVLTEEVRREIAAVLRANRAKLSVDRMPGEKATADRPVAKQATADPSAISRSNSAAGADIVQRSAGSAASAALMAEIAAMRSSAKAEGKGAAGSATSADRALLQAATNGSAQGSDAATALGRAEARGAGAGKAEPALTQAAADGSVELTDETAEEIGVRSKKGDAAAEARAPWKQQGPSDRQAVDRPTVQVKGAEPQARVTDQSAQSTRIDTGADTSATRVSTGTEKLGPDGDFRAVLTNDGLRSAARADSLMQPTGSRAGAHAQGQTFGQHFTNSLTPGGPADQVALRIQAAQPGSGQRITLQLTPRELGTVEIRLEMRDDQAVRASILAERSETLDMLQRDARGLERALNNAGLKTDSGSLNFDLRGQGQNHAQAQAQDHGHNQSGNGSDQSDSGLNAWETDADDDFEPLFGPQQGMNDAADNRLDIRI